MIDPRSDPASMRLTVHPGGLSGSFHPPGDKSITHRALLFGAIAEGVTEVRGANPGDDAASTVACVTQLGAIVQRDADAVRIQGVGGRWTEPAEILDCGNSGTTLRLLAGVLAAAPGLAVLTGDASLRARPVGRVIEPLRAMGATLLARAGDCLPPLIVRGAALRPIDFHLPVASAQVASAVLLAGLGASGRTRVTLGPARDHTERMLPAFGVPVDVEPAGTDGLHARSLLGPAGLRGATVSVPGDFSAAAFFLSAAAAIPGARVTARDVNLNPTRTGLLEVLEAMGADITVAGERVEGGEPKGDVTVVGPPRLAGVDWRARARDLPTWIDDLPALAIAACAADGVTSIGGARELRVKESDRLAGMAHNLAQLGVEVREEPDGLAIRGGRVRGGHVVSAGDHRIAMAFAVLGLIADGPVTVDDATAIATSFPGFVDTLRALGATVSVTPARGAA